MTQTNQNKDYSWLDKAFIPIALKTGTVDKDGKRTPDFDDWDTILREAKAVIQSHIDEHYIGKGEAAKEERAHENTLEQRDNAEEWADRLAYAKYDIQQIGEHSSANNPWRNAVELLESESKRIAGTHYSADGRGWIHANDFDKIMATKESEVEQRCIEARREGYDLALNQLYEWAELWNSNHRDEFNYYGAIKSLKVSKDMRLPFVQLSINNKVTLADVASPNPSPEAQRAIQGAVDRSMEIQRNIGKDTLERSSDDTQ